jgi:uncharacterized membrane protein
MILRKEKGPEEAKEPYRVNVEKEIQVNRPRDQVYRFWRDLENLPNFMSHLEKVKRLDEIRSHWTAKAPAGTDAEWNAEIIHDKENEEIAWRSIENSKIPNKGYVRFEDAPPQGTKVRVHINYEPPAGKFGEIVAKMFGREPAQEIERDLHRFKKLIEQ